VLPEAEALSGANKRVSNILSKLKKDIQSQAIDPTLFENSAEQDLFDQLLLANEKVAALAQDANYTAILKYLAKLQVSVDTFFDKVLVMTDDEARRENRLLLLKKLRELFLYVADIALLQ
jgi:glycyl-tRNA synthetase beta chain